MRYAQDQNRSYHGLRYLSEMQRVEPIQREQPRLQMRALRAQEPNLNNRGASLQPDESRRHHRADHMCDHHNHTPEDTATSVYDSTIWLRARSHESANRITGNAAVLIFSKIFFAVYIYRYS
jgi:hypothetical protein